MPILISLLLLAFPAFVGINVVLLNTLRRLRRRAIDGLKPSTSPSHADAASVLWVTVGNTRLRWEAELMEQVLIAHGMPTRLITLGVGFYMGHGSPAALQVHSEDEATALHLLMPVEEATETIE